MKKIRRKRDTNTRMRANDANKKQKENITQKKPNQRKDRLEILIVNGKATIQDYSEGHDSEKLIEMLKAIGIKPKVESDGPCG